MQPYIEIEASNKKHAIEFLKKIGFDITYTTNKTATEVIRHAGLNPDNLVFGKK